jgi:hypothetical protein
MRSALWSEPIAEAKELFLVNAVQHGNGRFLDDLVLERPLRELRSGHPSSWPEDVIGREKKTVIGVTWGRVMTC